MLTRRRLWLFGLALLVAGWGTYAFRIATPGNYDRGGIFKGADYRHFYVLGRLALMRQASALYDERLQVEIARVDFEPKRSDSFGRPAWGPQMALLFAPLAVLSYFPSWLLFSFLSALAYVVCCWTVARQFLPRNDRWLAAVLLGGYPGFVALITFGQVSALALIFLTLAIEGWKRKSDALVGLGVGLLCYKPTLAITPLALLVATAQWRPLLVALGVAGLQLLAGAMWFGFDTLPAYVRNLAAIASDPAPNEPHPELLHSFTGFFNLLLGRGRLASLLALACSAAIFGLLVAEWRRRGPALETYALLGVAIVLISPHLTTYDLVVLVPALLPLTRHLKDAGPYLAALYIAPVLSAAVGPSLRVQLSTVALVGVSSLLRPQSVLAPLRITTDTHEAD